MPVKHLLALSPIALAATLAGALPESQPPATATSAAPARAFTVATDRPDGLYRQGEPVVFSIRMTEDGQTVTGRTLAYTLTGDGGLLQTGRLASAAEPVTVTAKLDRPGWLNLKVTGSDAAGKPIPWWTLTGIAGAAVDPFEVRAGQTMPEDFDAFWAGEKTKLAAVPQNLVETPAALTGSAAALIHGWHVTSEIGPGLRPLRALVTIPSNAAPKSLPAQLSIPGAGVRSAAFKTEPGWISLTLNVHGLENLQPAPYYEAIRQNELKDYTRLGSENRDTFYFRGVFLRLLRALDYVKSRPEWDGRTLVVAGGSQGGGLALVAAGLDPAVTLCKAGMPGLCDHLGYTRKQSGGWPQLVALDKAGQPLNPAVARTSAYYDAALFAARIKAATEVSIGLKDTTCPPTSVFAAFNNLTVTNKTLWIYPEAGHLLHGRKIELKTKDP